MHSSSLLMLLASAGLIEGRSVLDGRLLHDLAQKRAAANSDSSLTLLDSVIQKGSFNDGSNEIGANEAQQAKSLTSQNNFINNCAGKTLTNGFQVLTGSCNGIPMGDIPAKTDMVSSIITFPLPGSKNIQSDTTFNVTVQTSNLVAGSFTNAAATYYAAPQFLEGGKVVGHTHVTIQDMGNSLNPTRALDPTQFAFFKGINDAGDGQGLLTATVTGGLPAGNYRVCTMASASNHQPVLMPVAQRGTADDCTKFTVSGSGTTINVAANDGSSGLANAALVASALAAGPGATDISSESSSATASATNKGGNGGGKNTKTAAASEATSTTAANNNGGGGRGENKGSTKASATTTASNNAGNGGGNAASTTPCNGATSTIFVDTPSSTAVVSAASTPSVAAIPSFSNSTSPTTSSSSALSTSSTNSLAVGGIAAPAVTKSGDSSRPFEVNGNTFVNEAAAVQRSCDIQFNACANAFNGGKAAGKFTMQDCSDQQTTCEAAGTKR